MSKPNSRGSLIGLRSNLPSLPKVAPVALTAEMEQAILGNAAGTPVYKDVNKDIRTDAQDLDAPSHPPPPARKREATVLMNAKLPASLHSRLKRTAQFNDISMTDILIRAIESELATGSYAAPPDTWGSDLM